MPTPDAEDVVLDAIAEVGGGPRTTLHLDHAIDEQIGIDSLDFVRLIQRLEERLSIRLPDQSVAAVKTVGDLVEVVRAASAADLK